ncbi:hypothetical protein AB4865_12695 [Capnocytophaga sp. ARDL2]|uniref:hypothetical protein n=1 Tax=Capnocytophaga sp. ARDL2 TaxID=3238809 RepID=UPI003556C838
MGYEAQDEILEIIEFIGENPFIYQKRFDDIRDGFAKRFSLGVYYYVNEKDQLVTIIAIINSKDNPNKIIEQTNYFF